MKTSSKIQHLALFAAVVGVFTSCVVAEASPPHRGTSFLVPSLPYGLQVDLLDESGNAFNSAVRGGARYVLGEAGQRYMIRITNPSGRRVEIVASVDGLDVVDGKPASYSKRGYVVNPRDQLTIEGWRTSMHEIAAFRFGSVSNSYAGRTSGARNVGVIGVALFAEREMPAMPIEPTYRVPSGNYGGGYPSARSEAAPPPAPPRAAKSAAKSVAPQASAAAPPAQTGAVGGRAAMKPEGMPAEERPGLGTEFGERMGSSVRMVTFSRDGSRPTAYAELRYNDRSGLARLGIVFPTPSSRDDTFVRETANPFPGNGFAAPPSR